MRVASKPAQIFFGILISCLAVSASAKVKSKTIGPWVIVTTSPEESWGETTFNVFRLEAGKRVPQATFTGFSNGDGGKHWDKTYSFSKHGKDGLQIEEIDANSEPVWELDPAGGIVFLLEDRRILQWANPGFLSVSSSTSLSLEGVPSNVAMKVRISGEVYRTLSDEGDSIEDAHGVVIGAVMRPRGGRMLRVKLEKEGEVFVSPESVRRIERGSPN